MSSRCARHRQQSLQSRNRKFESRFKAGFRHTKLTPERSRSRQPVVRGIRRQSTAQVPRPVTRPKPNKPQAGYCLLKGVESNAPSEIGPFEPHNQVASQRSFSTRVQPQSPRAIDRRWRCILAKGLPSFNAAVAYRHEGHVRKGHMQVPVKRGEGALNSLLLLWL